MISRPSYRISGPPLNEYARMCAEKGIPLIVGAASRVKPGFKFIDRETKQPLVVVRVTTLDELNQWRLKLGFGPSKRAVCGVELKTD